MLASTSPARKKLLTDANLFFETLSPGVDEEAMVAEHSPRTAEELTILLAEAKAKAVVGQTDAELILGCDSALEFGGEILGKPLIPRLAIDRWKEMRGQWGTLVSGHHLISPTASASLATKTRVKFAEISDEEIENYVATGEPLGVAGAFTIDSIGGSYVEKIEGDYHTVVGLSLVGLRQLMSKLGYNYQDFWR